MKVLGFRVHKSVGFLPGMDSENVLLEGAARALSVL